MANVFDTEHRLVEALSRCLPVCTVQGVNDYGNVLELAPVYAQRRLSGSRKGGAVFVYYLGDSVNVGTGDCYSWMQQWVIAVTSVNKCDLAHGTVAREENGRLVAHAVCCLECFDKTQGYPRMRRINAPVYPLFESMAGLAITLLAYETRVRIDCTDLPPLL